MSPLDNVVICDFPEISEPHRGVLTVIEEGSLPFPFPFPVRRVFYIYDVPSGISRGGHSHKSNTQLLVCLRGTLDLCLTDGRKTMDVHLDNPCKGIIIPPDVWNDLRGFSESTILLVLCSEPYNKSGYINDFEEFKNWIDTRYAD